MTTTEQDTDEHGAVPGAFCELTVRGPGHEPSAHRLTCFPATLGRHSTCDLAIDQPSISGLHAVLRLGAGPRLYLEDQASTNGIYLRGQRVKRILIDRTLSLTFGELTIELSPAGTALRCDSDIATLDVTYGPHSARAQCYYRRDDREFGPYTKRQLDALSRDGTLRHDDLIWTPTTSAWLRAELVPDLFDDQNRRAALTTQEQRSPRNRGAARRAPARGSTATARDLRSNTPADTPGQIVCPHCWHRFKVEEFLFIARHQSLIGDPVLGADAQQRFLPSRFTPQGNAVDSVGASCPDRACPRCHLRIPQPATEMPPLFLSIVGATASGKSYMLTSLLWQLRNTLAKNFAMTFTDADAINNQIVNEFEETLFLNSDADTLVALRKTELQGELYNQVLLDNMLINLPKPFMFSVTPAEHHPLYDDVREKMSRTLVLYDNAGEHFEPGMDSVDNPTTQHLLHSDIVFFLFDPTKDVRFRSRLESCDPQLSRGARVQRQEILLTEMINRIKKYSGMRTGAKSAKTLAIVVSKCDIWLPLLGEAVLEEPWRWDPKIRTCALDIDLIKRVSFSVRALLEEMTPELVATAESFAGDVLYLPNSALGRSPEFDPETETLGIMPGDIRPIWASVPMLYFFYERGFLPALSRSQRRDHETVPVQCNIAGDVAFVTLPDLDKPLQIPVFYLGSRLRCPHTGVWFDLPVPRSSRRQTPTRKRQKRKR